MTDQPPTAPSAEPGWSSAPAPSARPGPIAGYHYAGFWVRFLAFVLDVIVIGLITTALTPFFGSQLTVTGSS